MIALKGRYPWRVGATSFVVPAGVMENVQLLSSLIDDVQLLFFESAAKARLEHVVDVAALRDIAAEFDLTYTVHLPSDIRLGSPDPAVRRAGLDEILRLTEELAPLLPLSYDLHLFREPEQVESRWLTCIEKSLASLAEALGEARRLVSVENTDYPIVSVSRLVEGYGFSFCPDLGHLVRYRHDGEDMRRRFSQARHIHYHGVFNGKDHGAITHDEEYSASVLGAELADISFPGVVTLEMYDIDKLKQSLKVLKQEWAPFERRKIDHGSDNGAA